MTLVKIQVACPGCRDHSGDQPNYCRMCGGMGYLRSTVSPRKLARMGEIPTVLGCTVVGKRPAVRA